MAPSLEPFTDSSNGGEVKLAGKSSGTATDKSSVALKLQGADKHDLVLAVFRAYIADLCEQFKGGHPGSAMGMAAIGVALYKYVLIYSPRNCDYFNRDRYVLSNGESPGPNVSNLVALLTSSSRTCMRVAVSLHAPYRGQEYDCRTAQELPFV